MKESMPNNNSNAPIMRQGHTATTKHGSDPNMKEKGPRVVRDLKVK